jgi:hypothetical protein
MLERITICGYNVLKSSNIYNQPFFFWLHVVLLKLEETFSMVSVNCLIRPFFFFNLLVLIKDPTDKCEPVDNVNFGNQLISMWYVIFRI